MANFRLSLDYLPDYLATQLSRADWCVLKTLLHIFNLKGGELSYEYVSITPSENYMAERLRTSVSTISRSVTRLAGLGLVRISRGRRGDGVFLHNIYSLGKILKETFKKFTDRVKGYKKPPVASGANVVKDLSTEDNYYGHFVKFLKELTAKQTLSISKNRL